MTSEDVKSELERDPFQPIRLHLVSGKTLQVKSLNDAHLLQNAVLIFEGKPGAAIHDRYDVVALRNIERLELLASNGHHKGKKHEQKRSKND